MTRNRSLDVTRGAAMLGVFLVNYATVFRGPILDWLDRFHTRPGLPNTIADWLVGVGIESKAYAIFATLFGATSVAWVDGGRSIVRRLLVLLGFGVVHMALWDGDILLQYAVLGLLVSPLIRARPPVQLGAAAVLFVVAASGVVPDLGPADHRPWIEGARTAYQNGMTASLRFQVREAIFVMGPLLLGAAPRTAGLMLLGMAGFESGWLADSDSRPTPFRALAAVGMSLGVAATALDVLGALGRVDLGRAAHAVSELGIVALGVGYGSGLLLLARRFRMPSFEAIGRNSLTAYVVHSVVGVAIFRGFGAFDRLGSATAALLAVVLFRACARVAQSTKGRGPLEDLWRRLASRP